MVSNIIVLNLQKSKSTMVASKMTLMVVGFMPWPFGHVRPHDGEK